MALLIIELKWPSASKTYRRNLNRDAHHPEPVVRAVLRYHDAYIPLFNLSGFS